MSEREKLKKLAEAAEWDINSYQKYIAAANGANIKKHQKSGSYEGAASMSAEINNRKRFYGEVKGWPTVFAKIHPDVLRILNRYRGSKSWSRFMEDVAVMLESEPEKP